MDDFTFTGADEAKAAFIAAYCQATEGFGELSKDHEGQIGAQRFKYANLAAILKSVRKPLAAAKIGLFLPIYSSGDGTAVSVLLVGHGASMMATLRFQDAAEMDTESRGDRGIKTFGKITTYLRRYLVQGILALEGDRDADDDADDPRVGWNKGRGRPTNPTPQRPSGPPARAQDRDESPFPPEPPGPPVQTSPSKAVAEEPAKPWADRKPAQATLESAPPVTAGDEATGPTLERLSKALKGAKMFTKGQVRAESQKRWGRDYLELTEAQVLTWAEELEQGIVSA